MPPALQRGAPVRDLREAQPDRPVRHQRGDPLAGPLAGGAAYSPPLPPGVVPPPEFGTGVPPLWPVAVEVVAWVVVWTVVRGTVVEVDSRGVVVVVWSLLSSPATIIRPTANPMTRATRIPIVQRARVFTAAILAEGSAENPKRLLDLRLADHEWRQEAKDVGSDRVRDQALGEQAPGGVLGIDPLEPGAHHQAPPANLGDRADRLQPFAKPPAEFPHPAEQFRV